MFCTGGDVVFSNISILVRKLDFPAMSKQTKLNDSAAVKANLLFLRGPARENSKGVKLKENLFHLYLFCLHLFLIVSNKHQNGWTIDKRLQRSINTCNMRYFPQHVLLCTSTVHDQSGNICIQGYLRIHLIGNAKYLKIKVLFYV